MTSLTIFVYYHTVAFRVPQMARLHQHSVNISYSFEFCSRAVSQQPATVSSMQYKYCQCVRDPLRRKQSHNGRRESYIRFVKTFRLYELPTVRRVLSYSDLCHKACQKHRSGPIYSRHKNWWKGTIKKEHFYKNIFLVALGSYTSKSGTRNAKAA